MRRTTVVLDEAVLREARRITGEKTNSGAIMKALDTLVRRATARQILELQGTGLWEGDLSEMHGDRPRRRRRTGSSSPGPKPGR